MRSHGIAISWGDYLHSLSYQIFPANTGFFGVARSAANAPGKYRNSVPVVVIAPLILNLRTL